MIYLENLTLIHVVYTCQQHEVVNNSNNEPMSPTTLCLPQYILHTKCFEVYMYNCSPPRYALIPWSSIRISFRISCPLIGIFFFRIHFLNKFLRAFWVALALGQLQCAVVEILWKTALSFYWPQKNSDIINPLHKKLNYCAVT